MHAERTLGPLPCVITAASTSDPRLRTSILSLARLGDRLAVGGSQDSPYRRCVPGRIDAMASPVGVLGSAGQSSATSAQPCRCASAMICVKSSSVAAQPVGVGGGDRGRATAGETRATASREAAVKAFRARIGCQANRPRSRPLAAQRPGRCKGPPAGSHVASILFTTSSAGRHVSATCSALG